MKRLFTRRTAGTDAKVDRLVMEYARRSAASPLLQHTERLARDPSVKRYSDVEEALRELKK